MNIHRLNRPLSSRVLFVWDGTDKFISSADRFIRLLQGQRVYAVHAMPHESVYNYGSVNHLTNEKPRAAERLEIEFRKQASPATALRDCSFDLLFGDRINEIVVTATQLRAKFILIPRFDQSTFSKWIHGDLNEKIRAKATCPVIFLDAELQKTCPPREITAGSHQDHS